MKETITKIVGYTMYYLGLGTFVIWAAYHMGWGKSLVLGIALICLITWGHFCEKWGKENWDNRCSCLDYDGYALYCTCGYNPMTGKKDKRRAEPTFYDTI